MRSHHTRALSIAVVVLIGGVLTSSRLAVSGQQASSPYQWRGTVIQGGTIEIKGVNGAVQASAATGAEVEVSAVMRGKRSNPADVRIRCGAARRWYHDLRRLSEPGLKAERVPARRRGR